MAETTDPEATTSFNSKGGEKSQSCGMLTKVLIAVAACVVIIAVVIVVVISTFAPRDAPCAAGGAPFA